MKTQNPEQIYRTEKDSLGEVRVPEAALYGAQTQRAVDNFPVSGYAMPRAFIRALGLVKQSAALANAELQELDSDIAKAISAIAGRVAAGELDDEFPVDVFQTGSGTSSNMNANEVIAHLASAELGQPVNPNDHVNAGQSSNDVIPTAIHISACLTVSEQLLPCLESLCSTLQQREAEFADTIKTGRTHLMDAMPISFAQELGAWRKQLSSAGQRIAFARDEMLHLAQGGTAVGTGINAHQDFSDVFVKYLCDITGLQFKAVDQPFELISSQDAAVALSGQLKALATALMKISNDLRWMNSGPLAGLAEVELPALQPGSSIMPGKVNPVIPEAVAMVAAKVMGNDTTITVAGQSGNFQLNVMLPVVAYSLLESIHLLGNSCQLMAEKVISGFTVNTEVIEKNLAKNPILVTALNKEIGYAKAAEIAKKAYQQKRAIIDVAEEMSGISRDKLEILLAPKQLI